MNAETIEETGLEVPEEPLETNNSDVELIETDRETEVETTTEVSRKPRESKVYNHGTGKVTFVQALKLIEASRATLSRYTKDGKIPFETDQNGNKLYQVVDLERIFGKLKRPETEIEVSGNHEEPTSPDRETTLRLALLEQENQFLKERSERAEKEAADWKQQAERVTLMLTHRPEPAAPEQPIAVPEPKKRWWQFGGGR